MSIKGIDNQIMITRTTEVAKDVTAHQKKNELVQDYLAAQSKALAESENKKVAQTIKSQEAMIHNDRGSRSGEQYGGQAGNKHSGSSPDTSEDNVPKVPPEDHRIDIKI